MGSVNNVTLAKVRDCRDAAHQLIKIGQNPREAKLISNDLDLQAVAMKEPVVVLSIAKQRNGDFEGKLTMDFDINTYQYRTIKEHAAGRNYLLGKDAA